ncbi:dihydrofolate reductase family protein [Nocardia sp. NPDC049149]|uniref:dihydrofolate reductase family protein n=1 Tax=Nocardia sp. NPDC049149 TaxID=3364315 RepID=UPI003722693D
MVTQYFTATSLDGYLADENNSLSWLFAVDDGGEAQSVLAGFFANVGAMCMGSTTYEWILANEPAENWRTNYGDIPCWIFTHRDLPAIPGANLHFVADPVEPVHKEMAKAAGDKNIWVIGGGDLVGQFADAALLDEIIAGVAPVTLGSGAPLLPRRILSTQLNLFDVTQYGQFAQLSYRVTY